MREQGKSNLRKVCAREYWTRLYALKMLLPVYGVVYCKRVLFGQTGLGESRVCAWHLSLIMPC